MQTPLEIAVQQQKVPRNERGFWVGILIGLSIVSTVFAFSSVDTFAIFDMLMIMLAALLIAGITYKWVGPSPSDRAGGSNEKLALDGF